MTSPTAIPHRWTAFSERFSCGAVKVADCRGSKVAGRLQCAGVLIDLTLLAAMERKVIEPSVDQEQKGSHQTLLNHRATISFRPVETPDILKHRTYIDVIRHLRRHIDTMGRGFRARLRSSAAGRHERAMSGLPAEPAMRFMQRERP